MSGIDIAIIVIVVGLLFCAIGCIVRRKLRRKKDGGGCCGDCCSCSSCHSPRSEKTTEK